MNESSTSVIIKPCPFCSGGEGNPHCEVVANGAVVKCPYCDAQGPLGDAEDKAIEFWNEAKR